jgi:peptidoglycan/LPS O-acetylase OafA/YrhL
MINTIEKSAPVKHLGYLDGLRALAAIFVVFHHAFLQINFTDRPQLGFINQFTHVFDYGSYAVGLFITISGFCLMLPVAKGNGTIRHGTIDFFKRRAWRILPSYYLAMAISLLLVWLFVGQKTGTHWDTSLPVTGTSIFTHLILLQDAFGYDANINHVFWSIAVEWRIYFLFPLLVLGWRKIGPIPTTVLAVISSYILYNLFALIIGSSLSAHYLGLFVMGMLAATIVFSSKDILSNLRQLPWGWITILMSIIIVFISSAKISHGHILSTYIIDYFVGLWSMALLITISLNPNHWLAKFLNYQPIVFLGTFAYSIYLIHAPLLQILWQYVFTPFQSQPLLMFAALSVFGTPIIIGLSYLFFLGCERPFLSKGKKVSSQ